ncbi:MAG TPA: MmoB/DmpM family protein [Polyangiaceae bacterium]|jgi:hypothetical protein|nr:MmoB/DmpM family protein [Polyangiaceae bacterium]
MDPVPDKRDWVGPVLQAGTLSQAVLAAIRELQPEAEFIDRGSYVRVLAPGPCRVTRKLVEKYAGERLRFPGDLEAIMPSFKGRLTMSEEEASWDFAPRAGE